MRKIKQILLDACSQCPYHHYTPDFYLHTCSWNSNNLPREIEEPEVIPEWCPLEDHSLSFCN